MIPFVKDMQFEYGRPDQVSPLIRRVVANNPGPFTFLGTGTYIIGNLVVWGQLAALLAIAAAVVAARRQRSGRQASGAAKRKLE